jgi:hypothetical protein
VSLQRGVELRHSNCARFICLLAPTAVSKARQDKPSHWCLQNCDTHFDLKYAGSTRDGNERCKSEKREGADNLGHPGTN